VIEIVDMRIENVVAWRLARKITAGEMTSIKTL
jgi:hypothetical protein